MKENSNMSVLLRGIIRENPVLVLVLGTCPTLAVTNNVIGAFGMGIAALAPTPGACLNSYPSSR